MQRFGIGEMEMKMAKLLWEREGIGSGAVVTLCKEEFGWAKSTTYTMLRRLCEHGLFKNEKSIVTYVLTEEQYFAQIATEFIDDKFNGSLNAFVESHIKHCGLSAKDKTSLVKLLSSK